MLMAIFELTEMETKDEGPSLRIDRGLLPKLKAKFQRRSEGRRSCIRQRTYGEGWQYFRQHDLWQKAGGMCRRSKQGFYVQTSVNAILTNQRNHNS